MLSILTPYHWAYSQEEFVVLPSKQTHGSNEDSKRYVLLPSKKKDSSEDSKRYATVLFPYSYEAAVNAALGALKHYMPATASRENVEMLFPVTNNEGKQVWSVFDATTWALVAEEAAGKVLGIRQKIAPFDKKPFVTGAVGLTYGSFKDGATKWVSVKVDPPTCSPRINRPRSFLEAVDIIKQALPSLFLVGFPKLSTIDPDVEFKFYTFTSSKNGKPTTDCWVAFPEEAYHHDTIWRACVPKPFEILGFTLEQQSRLDGKASQP
ncbi:hypothetical protein HYPSUDRAFT_785840 [Hypholoma sublateritium FD-334 SS-4]|uniref:Uncharacterized protein n=1 Tax=Hypholoma sublateritium (strain FD-334 SS-4) TaxID=945553 RepID=A0A0D2MAX7_HYPSF|nr:hypothetical protein HYPSUDRAFT_785840 [Hypholoma sublateritium FD-334 SS-4]